MAEAKAGGMIEFAKLAEMARRGLARERGRALEPPEATILSKEALDLIEKAASEGLAPPDARKSYGERMSSSQAKRLGEIRDAVFAGGGEATRERLRGAQEDLARRYASALCRVSEDGKALALAGGEALVWVGEEGQLRCAVTRDLEEAAGAPAGADAQSLALRALGEWILKRKPSRQAGGSDSELGFSQHLMEQLAEFDKSDLLRERLGLAARDAIGMPPKGKRKPEGAAMGFLEAFARCFYASTRVPSDLAQNYGARLSWSLRSLPDAEAGKAMSDWKALMDLGGRFGAMRSGARSKAVEIAAGRLEEFMRQAGAESALEGLRLAAPSPRRRYSIAEIAEATQGREKFEAAAKVAREAKGAGAFSLMAARALGLEIGDGVVGQVKGELKREGLITEGGWKKLAEALSGGTDLAERLIMPGLSEALRILEGTEGTPERRRERSREALLTALREPLSAFSLAAAAGASAETALSVTTAEVGHSDRQALRGLMGLGLPEARVGTPEAAKNYAQEWEAKEARKGTICAGLLRRADKAGIQTALTEWGMCWDWLSRAGAEGVWQSLPEKPDWAYLMNRQRQWHEMILAKQRGDQEKLRWTPAVGKLKGEGGEIEAVELSDAYALWEEGQQMSHCVSSYSDGCKRGLSRIFSIRDEEGRRLATLEIKPASQGDGKAEDDGSAKLADLWPESAGKEPNRFRTAQLRGKCNAGVTDERVIALAEEVARKASDRLAKDWRRARGEEQPEQLDLMGSAEPEQAKAPAGP